MQSEPAAIDLPATFLATRRGFEPPIGSPPSPARDAHNRSRLTAKDSGREWAIPSPSHEIGLTYASAETTERAERDGCGCPRWIGRCAHFGDAILIYTPHSAEQEPHRKCDPAPFNPFTVLLIKADSYFKCPGCGVDRAVAHVWFWDLLPRHAFDSEAEALAAFYAAEEALLAGGDA